MEPSFALDAGFCLHLTFTLLHFLWQGVAVALLALAAGSLLRRAGAAARYWLFVAALGTMALCPPLTFLALAPRAEDSSTRSVPAEAAMPAASGVSPVSISPAPGAFEIPAAPAAPRPRVAAPAPAAPSLKERLLGLLSPETLRRAAPWVAAGYFAGVLLMLARLLLALRGGRSLRGAARPVTEPELFALLERAARAVCLGTAPAVAWCGRVAVPTVVGIVRPMVLLPLALSSGLASDQIEMLLLHELAHLRRRDHWVNLAQWAIETILFFHPAVWLVSRRIRTERELACDDMVLAAGVGQAPYAESLLRMAELSRHAAGGDAGAALALGSHGTRFTDFGRRVLRLIEGGEARERVRPARVWPLGVALLVLVTASLAVALRSTAQEEGAGRDQKGSGQPGNGQPGVVTFSNGIRAEVVGVAENPRKGNECWSVIGEPLPQVPEGFKDVFGKMRTPGNTTYEFYVRLTHLPNSSDIAVRTACGSLAWRKNEICYRSLVSVPIGTRETSLRLGVASGPWELVTITGDSGSSGGSEKDPDGSQGKLVFSPAFREGDKVSMVVSSTGGMANMTKANNIRLVAIDHQSGRQYIGEVSISMGGGDFIQSTYVINNIPAQAKIVRYELQKREYEWREIKGIRLAPQRTTQSKTEKTSMQESMERVHVLIAALARIDWGTMDHMTLQTYETDETRELVRIGKPAVPALIAALKNPSKNIRRHCALALGKIGDPAALDPLLDLCRNELFHGQSQYRKSSTYDNDVCEPASLAVLAILFPDHAGNTNWFFGGMAGRFSRALKQLGPDQRGVLPLLEAMRDDPDPYRQDRDGALHRAVEAVILKFSPGKSMPAPALSPPSQSTGQTSVTSSLALQTTKIAWGKEVYGLRAALVLEPNKADYRIGETIPCRFQVQNVSNTSTPLEYQDLEMPGDLSVTDFGDAQGRSMAALPAVRAMSCTMMKSTLAPGEVVTVRRFALIVQPPGWEGGSGSTVVFAQPGRYKLKHTLVLGVDIAAHPPWPGEITSGEVEINVAADPSGSGVASFAPPVPGVTLADIDQVIRLLSDYHRGHLEAIILGAWDERVWSQNEKAWEARCAELGPGALKYLGHVASRFAEEYYRAAACKALGASRKKEAHDLLVPALKDASSTVRDRAVRALRWVDAKR